MLSVFASLLSVFASLLYDNALLLYDNASLLYDNEALFCAIIYFPVSFLNLIFLLYLSTYFSPILKNNKTICFHYSQKTHNVSTI